MQLTPIYIEQFKENERKKPMELNAFFDSSSDSEQETLETDV